MDQSAASDKKLIRQSDGPVLDRPVFISDNRHSRASGLTGCLFHYPFQS